jgi:O-antigen ligase
MKRAASLIGQWYFVLILALWVFSPGLRRLVDWQTSFHKESLFSVLPLVAMIPGVILAFSRWPSLGLLYRRIAMVWLASFAYAFLIGILSGSRVSAMYDAVTFVFPVLIGAFLVSSSLDVQSVYRRLATTLLWLAAISSVYAIFQYVSPSPWDVYWVENSQLESIGQPIPFGLRVFGTLNSYGIFAHFLSIAIVLNLPRLRGLRSITPFLFIPCVIALILTLDRTSWITCALGVALYIAFAPGRKAAALSLASIVIVCCLVSAGMLALTQGSESASSSIQERFSTLGQLSDDTSVASRQQQSAEAFHDGVSEPLGQGLGQVGTSSVAGSSGTTLTLDNGYLARFLELGFIGFLGYIAAIAMALVGTFAAYKVSASASMPDGSNALAAMLAIQVMFAILDLSTDAHNSFLGVLFWCTLFLTSRFAMTVVSKQGSPARLLQNGSLIQPVS